MANTATFAVLLNNAVMQDLSFTPSFGRDIARLRSGWRKVGNGRKHMVSDPEKKKGSPARDCLFLFSGSSR
jgi:hypothetical protein